MFVLLCLELLGIFSSNPIVLAHMVQGLEANMGYWGACREKVWIYREKMVQYGHYMKVCPFRARCNVVEAN